MDKEKDKGKDKEGATINAVLDAIRVMNGGGGGDDDEEGGEEEERVCCCMMPGCTWCCITKDKKKKKKKDMKRLETLLRQVMNRPGRNPFGDQTHIDVLVDAIQHQVGRGGTPFHPERPSIEAVIWRIYERILAMDGGGRDQTIIGGIIGPNIGCGNFGGGRAMYPPFFRVPY